MSQRIKYIESYFAVNKIALRPLMYRLQRSKKTENITIVKSNPRGDS